MNINNQTEINITDKYISVIGLGKSGMGSAKLANHLGARVFASDSSQSLNINQNALELMEKEHIATETGIQSDRIYDADLWIISPGIPKNSDIILKAQSKKIPIVSELEFASWFTKKPIISVTGSNGKTTTCFILYEIFKSKYKNSVLAGNIGTPFSEYVLEEVLKPMQDRVYILEVSSFQLEFINHFKPNLAVYTNISPDHLDRHLNMNEYISMKMEMIKNLDEFNYVIYNSDDEVLSEKFEKSTLPSVPFSLNNSKSLFSIKNDKIYNKSNENLIDLKESSLKGFHNYLNILAAATSSKVYGIADKNIKKAIYSMKSIEHRQEIVQKRDEVEYINDSKSTNIESVIVAIKTFKKPIILLLGGFNKGSDFQLLLPHIKKSSLKLIICYGESGEQIITALGDAVRSFLEEGLHSAVIKAQKLAIPGDIVLLSPGCASYDEFENFEKRGEFFKKIVNKIS